MARCGCSGASCDQVRDCISAGSGISYDPNTGVISTNPTCEFFRSCISAGTGISYNPGTGVISATGGTDCAAVRNCISATDGVAYNPGTGVATINAANGCGILGNGTLADPIRANVSAWPFPCATNLGGGIYCDGDVLRGEPMPKAQFFGQTFNEQLVEPGNLIPVAQTQVALVELEVTNPDTCRPALVIGSRLLDMDFTLPPNAVATYGFEGDAMGRMDNGGTATQDIIHTQVEKMFSATVAAGATTTFDMMIFVSQGTNGARYSRIQASISAWLITLPA